MSSFDSPSRAKDQAAAVLVIGASGLLGRALLGELQHAPGINVTGTALRRADAGCVPFDLTNQAAVANFMAAHRPAVTVIVSGEKRTDVCERDPARAHALNVAGPAWVACCAAAFGGRVLYISTDYVFDGGAPPYRPDSPTHPINAYGRSKRAGELAVLAAGKGMAVLRLPLLFGATDDLSESAVTSALLPPRGNQPVPVDDWATRYPTSTADVAIVCRQMIAAWLAGATLDGIFHWSGKEPHTKYTLCLLLAQLAGLPDDCFRPVLPGPAEVPRPRDCQLDSGALEALGIGARTPLREGLARVLQPHLQWLAPRWAAREGDGRR